MADLSSIPKTQSKDSRVSSVCLPKNNESPRSGQKNLDRDKGRK